jgi:acyl-CoA thioesterase FadM
VSGDPAAGPAPGPAPDPAAAAASVVVTRKMEWQDTDAAGHHHHSAVLRWVESAETVLYERLGLTGLMGVVPRVRYEVDFVDRLFYRDLVEIELSVAEVGRTSATFAFEIRGPRGPAAHGRMVIVHVASPASGATPWPETTRKVLLTAGQQAPDPARAATRA